MSSKIIRMYLKQGTMDNIVKVDLANWNGKVIKLPRTEVNNYIEDDCNSHGIYFLIGKKDDNQKDFVYVGESRNVIKRLKEHIHKFKSNDNIPYWNSAIVIVGKELDITSIKYLEWKFFNIIKDANNYLLTTKMTGKKIIIKDYHKDIMKEFLSNAMILISTLGYRLFEKIEIKNGNDVQYFYCFSNRNTNAKGFQNENGFVVLKDSVISNDVVNSFPIRGKGYYNLRQKLIEDKIIVNGIFRQDYQFSSPSAAGSVVLGRMYNDDWKTKEGKKFSELKI